MLKRITTITLILSFVLISQPFFAIAESDQDRRKKIETELQNVERQILVQQRLVEEKQVERRSLERDVSLINNEIKKSKLEIQSRLLAIGRIANEIEKKETILSVLEERLIDKKKSLSNLIRKSSALEDFTFIEVLLSKDNFSEFFSNIAFYDAIKDSINKSLSALKDIRLQTLSQKYDLEDKKSEEAKMRRLQELEKQEIENKKKKKSYLLSVTKGKEKEYKALLDSQRKTAAQLRSALFELLGGGGGIPFPEAVRLAKYASGVTGVDAALILAILEQETSLGKNLGGCLFTDSKSGRSIMHPTRDEPIFLAIAKILGFNPNTRTVSCPYTRNGSRIGWGGAMGPSQFIPSTWARYGGVVQSSNGYIYDASKDRIRKVRGGVLPANPFNNQDAFIATALLLRDNGANGTYAADRLSALRYYAGFGGASNPSNAFYGDQVMNRRSRLQQEMEILAN